MEKEAKVTLSDKAYYAGHRLKKALKKALPSYWEDKSKKAMKLSSRANHAANRSYADTISASSRAGDRLEKAHKATTPAKKAEHMRIYSDDAAEIKKHMSKHKTHSARRSKTERASFDTQGTAETLKKNYNRAAVGVGGAAALGIAHVANKKLNKKASEEKHPTYHSKVHSTLGKGAKKIPELMGKTSKKIPEIMGETSKKIPEGMRFLRDKTGKLTRTISSKIKQHARRGHTKEASLPDTPISGALGAPLEATLIDPAQVTGHDSIFNGELPEDQKVRDAIVKHIKSMKGTQTEPKSEQTTLGKEAGIMDRLRSFVTTESAPKPITLKFEITPPKLGAEAELRKKLDTLLSGVDDKSVRNSVQDVLESLGKTNIVVTPQKKSMLGTAAKGASALALLGTSAYGAKRMFDDYKEKNKNS